MLVTFKSKAAAEVVMYKEHARPLLELIGKDVQRGVITAAEAANAVAKLEVVIAESKVHPTTEEVKRDVVAHPESWTTITTTRRRNTSALRRAPIRCWKCCAPRKKTATTSFGASKYAKPGTRTQGSRWHGYLCHRLAPGVEHHGARRHCRHARTG